MYVCILCACMNVRGKTKTKTGHEGVLPQSIHTAAALLSACNSHSLHCRVTSTRSLARPRGTDTAKRGCGFVCVASHPSRWRDVIVHQTDTRSWLCLKIPGVWRLRRCPRFWNIRRLRSCPWYRLWQLWKIPDRLKGKKMLIYDVILKTYWPWSPDAQIDSCPYFFDTNDPI